MRNHILVLSSLFIVSSLGAAPQNAEAVFQSMIEKSRARSQQLESYIVIKSMMGMPVAELYEAVNDGSTFQGHRLVPLNEILQRLEAAAGISPQDKRAFAEGYFQGVHLGAEALASSGHLSAEQKRSMGKGLMNLWTFLDAAAPSGTTLRKQKNEAAANTRESIEGINKFRESAKLVGIESVSGRNGYHLSSNELGTISMDGADSFAPQKTSLWVDAQLLVPLKMKIEGTVTRDGKKQPMTLEMENSDFRPNQDLGLAIPFKQVMRMGGMLNAKEKKQMQEAQKKLAEFEKQMASMPADQKAMLERMMGNQLEMFRNMASSGGIEVETVIHKVIKGSIEEYKEALLLQAANLP